MIKHSSYNSHKVWNWRSRKEVTFVGHSTWVSVQTQGSFLWALGFQMTVGIWGVMSSWQLGFQDKELKWRCVRREGRGIGDCFRGSQPEGHLLVPASWRRVPSKEQLCCRGGWVAGEAIIWEQKADSSFLESERQVIHCCSVTLRASALGNSQYDFLSSSFFDQRPPGSVPAVLMGFQPALALTGALCLQQVLSTCCLRASGWTTLTHTFTGEAKPLEPGSETRLWISWAKPGRGLEGSEAP